MKTTILALLAFLTCSLHADLVVSGGQMVIAGGTVQETTKTTVQTGATLQLDAGSELITPLLEILTDALLRGCGTVTGDVENQGQILADCGTGQTLVVGGDLTNDGGIRAENYTGFTVAGNAQNNGLLDLIFSPSVVPPGLTGEVVTAGTLPPMFTEWQPGGSIDVIFKAYPGHLYQFLSTPDLTAQPVVWNPVGAPRSVNSVSELSVSVPLPGDMPVYYRYEIQD